jgi:hypothetical protein
MNLKDHWLYSLVLRLWPEIVDKDERQQTQAVLGIIPLIYLGPFAFLGLVWLILVTDISQLFASGFSYLLLPGTMLLLLNQPFNIYIGLGGRANIALTSSLAPLVLWSTV